LDQIEVAVGNRVERSRVNGDSARGLSGQIISFAFFNILAEAGAWCAEGMGARFHHGGAEERSAPAARGCSAEVAGAVMPLRRI
jgi:hypothetical protein